MFGVALPMLTLLVRSPIYTRIYTPELYGKYTLIYITFTYLSSLFYNWITSSGWRYYLKYKRQKKKEVYGRIILLLYFISTIVLFIITIIWSLRTVDLFQKKLIIYGFLFALTQELVNTLLIPMRMESKAKEFNLLSSGRAVLSFGLLLLMTFKLNFKIEAFFIAPVLVNGIILIVLIYFSRNIFLNQATKLNVRLVKLHIFRFIKYGLSTFIYNTGMFLLNSADRYIILLFAGYEKVGIYNQTYNISQLSIAAIFAAINAAYNPLLLGNLDKKPNQSDTILSKSIFLAIYTSAPFVLLLSFYAKEISDILLGAEFREAHLLMPFIFMSSFLSGLSHYASVKLKFLNKLKELIIAAVLASLINILSNLILVYFINYRVAAYTTLFSYTLMFIYLFVKSGINPFRYSEFNFQALRLIIILALISFVHFGIRALNVFAGINEVYFSIGEGVVLLFIFCLGTWHFSPYRKNAKLSYDDLN